MKVVEALVLRSDEPEIGVSRDPARVVRRKPTEPTTAGRCRWFCFAIPSRYFRHHNYKRVPQHRSMGPVRGNCGDSCVFGFAGFGLCDWNYDSCRWELCNPMTPTVPGFPVTTFLRHWPSAAVDHRCVNRLLPFACHLWPYNFQRTWR